MLNRIGVVQTGSYILRHPRIGQVPIKSMPLNAGAASSHRKMVSKRACRVQLFWTPSKFRQVATIFVSSSSAAAPLTGSDGVISSEIVGGPSCG